ncbi:MAG: recombination regulator RecX [Pseudomonadota bacterium]
MRAAVVNWPFKVIQGGGQPPASDDITGPGLVRGKTPAPQASAAQGLGKTPSVKARAVNLLAQREYSRQALQDKLQSENASPEDIEQALAQLEAKGLVSDARVAETLVHRRAGKLGGMRLRQELQAKGVSPELVAETMAGLKDSELARALAIWQKKFGHVATDAATRNRQARFLATRGFSGDVVRQVVAGVSEDD